MVLLLFLWTCDIINSKNIYFSSNGSATITACHATDDKVDLLYANWFFEVFLRNNHLYTSKIWFNSCWDLLLNTNRHAILLESFLHTKWHNTTTWSKSKAPPPFQVSFIWHNVCNPMESTVITAEQQGPRLQQVRACSNATATGTKVKGKKTSKQKNHTCLPLEDLR